VEDVVLKGPVPGCLCVEDVVLKGPVPGGLCAEDVVLKGPVPGWLCVEDVVLKGTWVLLWVCFCEAILAVSLDWCPSDWLASAAPHPCSCHAPTRDTHTHTHTSGHENTARFDSRF